MSTLKWAKCGSEKQCNIKQRKHKEGNENKEKTGQHLTATALIIATHIYLKPLWAPAFISEFSAAKFSTLLSCTCDISQSSSQVLLLCEVDKRCDDVSVGTSLTLFFSLFSFSGNRTKWDELKHTDFTDSPPLCGTYTVAVKICNWKWHHHWLQRPFRHHLKTRAFRKKQRRMKHQRVLSEELVCDFRQCSWFAWHLPAK